MIKNDELRKRAEEMTRDKAAQSPENLEALSPDKTRQMLHELRVHQIELEMQNEELRTAQAELEAARARYFNLYDLAPVGLCTISEQGLIVEANLTAATLLGMGRGALVRQLLSRFILKEDQDIYYLYCKQLFSAGAPQECELRMVTMDGAPFWARMDATVAQADDGAPVGRVVISDITERKQAEETLQQAHNELEQRVAERTEELRQANEGLRVEIIERKQVEESLKLVLADWESILQAVGQPTLILDPQFKILEANSAALKASGQDLQELNGKRCYEVFHKTDHAPESCPLIKMTASGHLETSEMVVETLDSTFFVSCMPVFDETGNLQKVIHVAIDITERKRAEVQVRERMKELSALYSLAELARREDITPDELYKEIANILPKSWLYAEITCARLVIDDSEFRTKNFAESPWMQSAPIMVNREVVGRIEVGYLEERPEGGEGPFLKEERLLINAIAEQLGRIIERKQAEENLARLSQQNELILHSAGVGILGLNLQGNQVFTNPAAARMLGYEAEELIGRPSHSTWHHTKADGSPYLKEECNIYAAYRDGAVHCASNEVFWRKDGTSFPVEYASTPVYEQGRLTGAVVTFIDITERKRAEKETRQAREQLEQLNKYLVQAREDERAIISREIHDELGQSLTAIKIDLHWTLENIGDKPAVNLKLNNVLEMVSGAITSVQQLASKLRPGILDDLGLAPAIEWYCEEFEKRTGIHCQMDLEDFQSKDKDKILTLFRILQESLTNVVRHAQAKSVTIKLSCLPDAVNLEIHDDGIGIDQEKIDSNKSLGLIGMRARVRQCSGDLKIYSPNNKGTWLRISLPLNK